MNHVERAPLLDGISDHVGVDIEFPDESAGDDLDVREPDIRDYVNVLRGAGDPVERTGDRAANDLADPEGIEDAREFHHDEDGLGEHQ